MFGTNSFFQSPGIPMLDTFHSPCGGGSGGNMSATMNANGRLKKVQAGKATRRRKWKKPKGKPKRPLSAYNLFFQKERELLVKSKTRVGFADMAKSIAAKWKRLEDGDKTCFNAQAEKEQQRYKVELEAWEKEQEKQRREQEAKPAGCGSLLNLQQQSNMLQTYLMQQQVMMQIQAMKNQSSVARGTAMPLSGAFQQQANYFETLGRLPTSCIPQQQILLPLSSGNPINKHQQQQQQQPEDLLDAQTSDLLLSMPIADTGENSGGHNATKAGQKSLEEQIADFDLSSGLRGPASVPLVREHSLGMNEILTMLDEDDKNFQSMSAV